MLDKITFADFSTRLDERFQIQAADTALPFELVEVKKLGPEPTAEDDFRQAFSLIFLGPTEPLLPQHIYDLEHETMGVLPLFLVPLGPDKSGRVRYEAVFT